MSRSEFTSLPKTAPRFSYGYVMVGSAFIIMLLSWGLYVVFGVFFDPLLEEFGWTRTMISGAYSLSAILSGVMGIAMGGLTDRFGPRLVVTFCGFCLGLGYLLMSQVHALWEFYLYYGVVIGIGMSGVWIPLVSPIAKWFMERRSLMTGIVISGLTVGQLIAPPVISRLISAYGWRLSYIILGGVVMVIVIVLAQFLRRQPGHLDQSPIRKNEEEKPDFKSASQDFNLREAFHTPQFWLVAVVFFCVGWAAFAATVHIVPHAIDLGMSPVTAANILAVNGGIGIIGNFVLGGFIGDQIGNRKAFLIGLAMMAASLFFLVPARDTWMFYLFALVFGIGLGGTGTSESPLIARLFGLSSHGLIYGMAALSWTIGSAIGPVVAGYMFDVIGNYRLAFLVAAIVAVLGLVLLIMLKPTKRRGMEL